MVEFLENYQGLLIFLVVGIAVIWCIERWMDRSLRRAEQRIERLEPYTKHNKAKIRTQPKRARPEMRAVRLEIYIRPKHSEPDGIMLQSLMNSVQVYGDDILNHLDIKDPRFHGTWLSGRVRASVVLLSGENAEWFERMSKKETT